ncbi:MAG: DUF4198 domain-containing protein [Nitrospirae bacterium]|nr:DUF4198 domain-containing protein [Nitrospirota bacterium]
MGITRDISSLYISGDYKPVALENRTQQLTFAVYLIDDYTGSLPRGRIDLKISRRDRRPVRNQSGYYCFLNLEDGQYTLEINSGFYLKEKETIKTGTLNKKAPVKEVRLKPAPSYPFPSYATLVRGVLKKGTEPVEDAEVTVKSTESTGVIFRTRTDPDGEFVVYIKSPGVKGISIELQRDGDSVTEEVDLKEGTTVSLGVIKLLG